MDALTQSETLPRLCENLLRMLTEIPSPDDRLRLGRTFIDRVSAGDFDALPLPDYVIERNRDPEWNAVDYKRFCIVYTVSRVLEAVRQGFHFELPDGTLIGRRPAPVVPNNGEVH